MKPLFNKRCPEYILLSVLILLILSPVQITLAAEGVRLIAGRVDSSISEQISFPISVENAVGTEGGQFILLYDQNLIRPISVETGDLLNKAYSSMHMANLEYAPGQLIYMWVTAAGDTENSGVICNIIFQVLKEGDTDIKFKDVIISPPGTTVLESVEGSIIITKISKPVQEGNNRTSEGETELRDAADVNYPVDADVRMSEPEEANYIPGNLYRIENLLVIGFNALVIIFLVSILLIRWSQKKNSEIREN